MTLTNLERIHRGLPRSRRGKIAARAQYLIAEEMSLRDLRAARRRTQASIASSLGIGQDSVSRLEQRSDALLSTLRGYVEAVGGHLSLVAQFPDREPIVLSSFGPLTTAARKPRRKRRG